MAKPIKILLAALLVLALLGGAGWLLLSRPPAESTSSSADETLYLVQKTPEDVARVEVENQHGGYTVTWEGGAYTVADLPAHLVND